jgi:signal transduction histidine kinase
MNNVVKHAKAENIKISLLKTKESALKLNVLMMAKVLILKFLKKTKQFGLMGIKERAQSLEWEV